MSDIPIFSSKGKTSDEKITEITSYLSSLYKSLDQSFLSIGFGNLNQELSDRINNSLTDHQDLTSFASKKYTKDYLSSNYYDQDSINAQNKVINENIEGLGKTVDGKADKSAVTGQITDAMDEVREGFSGEIYLVWKEIEKLQGRVSFIEATLEIAT